MYKLIYESLFCGVAENYHRRRLGRVSQQHLLCFSSQFMCPPSQCQVCDLHPLLTSLQTHTHSISPGSPHRAIVLILSVQQTETIGCSHKSAMERNSHRTKLGKPSCCSLLCLAIIVLQCVGLNNTVMLCYDPSGTIIFFHQHVKTRCEAEIGQL